MRFIGVIPARYGSTRFPGKPLALIVGRPMIHHVYERALKIPSLSEVVVATEDERIADAVRMIGGKIFKIRASHPTGSDAVAEVAETYPSDTVVVNIQGDLPIFNPTMVEEAIETYKVDGFASMTTVATPIIQFQDWHNPNVVKVVRDQSGRALYFSRHPIPYGEAALPLRHIGLYVYSRRFLLEFITWKQTPLEQAERLEQLRILENGHSIAVSITTSRAIEVDTPDDIFRAERGIWAGW